MSLDIHVDSIQYVFIPVANVHPTTGPVNLSTLDVEVALPTVGVAPSSWIVCAWATGSMLVGDRRYYVVEMDLDDFTIAAGSTYQPWVRIGGATGSISKSGDTIRVINT